MKRHSKNATPLLTGFLRSDDRQIFVWCPYCKCYHAHGWSPENKSDEVEHREAHCEMSSPLRLTGYFIGLAPKRATPGGRVLYRSDEA